MTTQKRKRFTAFKMMMIIVTAVFLFLLGTMATLSAATTQAQSNTPNLINYQGYLTDDAGDPLDGTATLTFDIYPALTGGSPLWSETQTNVPVSDGYFSVMLGSVKPLNAATFSKPTRYLQVGVDSGGGMVNLPRQQFTAVPYALQAANAWSLNGNSGTDPLTHKLGTTDETSLTFVVSDTAVLRIEPAIEWDDDFTPNIIVNPLANSIEKNLGAFGIVIGGGANHEVTGHSSLATISGGWGNLTEGNLTTIGGGSSNEARGYHATIGGGKSNTAVEYATVSGGTSHNADGTYSTVGGGSNNDPAGNYATISGGQNNFAAGSHATVGGGTESRATGNYATVGGGQNNDATGKHATIGGGHNNLATGDRATVGGGIYNNATGNYATVSGGTHNEATGYHAMISGGAGNTAAGSYSYAAGRGAQANHDGAFVWTDSSLPPFTTFDSTAADQFLVNANGGMGVGTNAPATQLHVLGATNGAATISDHVVVVENNSTAVDSGPDILALKVTNQTNPGGSTNFITFMDQSGGIAAIEGNGNGGVSYKTSGADFAEYLPLENPAETIAAGTVVGLSQGRISQQTAGAEQVFVISSAAGFVGNAAGDEEPEGTALVALMGQVDVQVSGAVQAGDYIIASGLNDGVGIGVPPAALRADQVGQVVGLALESTNDGGKVLVLVGVPHNTIWQALLQARDAQLAEMEARLSQLEQLLLDESACNAADSSQCP